MTNILLSLVLNIGKHPTTMKKGLLKTHNLSENGTYCQLPNPSSLSLRIPTIPLSTSSKKPLLPILSNYWGQKASIYPLPPYKQASYICIYLPFPSFLHQRTTCLPCSLPLVWAFFLFPSPILDHSVHILTSLLSSISLLVLSVYPSHTHMPHICIPSSTPLDWPVSFTLVLLAKLLVALLFSALM